MISGPTIYAVSSGQGRAGVAVVRLSGSAVRNGVLKLAGRLPEPRRFSQRTLRFADGTILDQAVVIWLPGPNTVTGEDMAEFHVHGSPAVLAALFKELSGMAEMRPADAGEFTRRAFVNGRTDLLGVEGLADLLAAEGEAQRRLAMRQFSGESGAVIGHWREVLLQALALLEAAIDFSDEADVAVKATTQARSEVAALLSILQMALQSSGRASAIRRGLRVVIAGPPNVGKSSLLNWLAAREAAIVSSVAGTTRDVVEAPLTIAGLQVTLADTAGLRSNSSDPIEAEGMRRSAREVEVADILIWVTARDVPDFTLPARVPDLVVLNKSDLVAQSIHPRNDPRSTLALPVSVKSGAGLDDLRRRLADLIRERTALGEHDVIVRERHRLALEESIRFLNDAIARSDIDLELMAEDVRNAARSLSVVTGQVGVEDLLGKIFQDFCIGK